MRIVTNETGIGGTDCVSPEISLKISSARTCVNHARNPALFVNIKNYLAVFESLTDSTSRFYECSPQNLIVLSNLPIDSGSIRGACHTICSGRWDQW